MHRYPHFTNKEGEAPEMLNNLPQITPLVRGGKDGSPAFWLEPILLSYLS